MTEPDENLTIEVLADRAGVSVRTVRYYISQGLLPGPGARGKAATYGTDHLARLQLIRRLVDQHVPLTEQRARLEGLTLPEVQSLLRTETQYASRLQRAARTPSPKAYVSELLAQARAAPAEQHPGSVPPSVPVPYAAPSVPAEPSPQGWTRWELADGVELHVRRDLTNDHSDLISRLLNAVREAPGRESNPNAAFEPGGFSHDT